MNWSFDILLDHLGLNGCWCGRTYVIRYNPDKSETNKDDKDSFPITADETF